MKRYFSIFVIALCTLTVFNACSDVPAPYKIPGEDPGDGDKVYLQESFSSSLGSFSSYSAEGNLTWIIDYSSACITGYNKTDKTNTAGITYLVSPYFDLSYSSGAHISFSHAINYERVNIKDNNQLVISKDYEGDVATATWEVLPFNTEGTNSDFTFVLSGKINIPSIYLGQKNIVIAFRHSCNDKSSSTWEVKNVVVKEGVSDNNNDNEEEEPVSGNLLENGDAETWENSQPAHWKSASTASSATLSQSTDAHSGSYSICVVGATTNKRLAYEEITLKAGTYTLTFYAKAATADGGSIRPGYTSVIDGVAQSNGYKYGSYSDNLTNTEWREITHEFTLESTTTLCLVFMNPKQTGKDVLLDDFSLTTANGGLADGSNDDENDDENDTPTANITYTKVTTISAGTYIIAANVDGTYKVATPLGATANYGYLKNPVDATENNNTITLSSAANEFVIESTSGGYTIKDGNDKYYYMSGSYNSFNVGTSLPAEGGVWNITFNADGTANLVNTTMNKTLQYDTEFGSYGVYDTIKATLPALYKKN